MTLEAETVTAPESGRRAWRRPIPRPRHESTSTRSRVVGMLVYAALLAAYCLTVGIPGDTVSVFVWLWVATIAWNNQAPWRQQFAFPRDWWIPLAGLVFYFYSRAFAASIGIATHYTMPIRFDEFVGGGELPTVRLQHLLCGNPCLSSSSPRWYDAVFALVYLSHFVTGLTIAAVLWVRDRALWLPWMRRLVALNLTGLLIYMAYPMAPPWVANRDGYLPVSEHVSRLTSRGARGLGINRFDLVLNGLSNQVAAMPSLHAGTAVLVSVYGITRLRTRWRWLLVLYPLAMATTLIYNGEHYVVDILAGALLAVLVLLGSTRWERWRASVRPEGVGERDALPDGARPAG